MVDILRRMTDIIKAARLDEFFTLWDADSSGFLEKDEFNRVVALYNGVDYDVLTDAERDAKSANLIGKWDSAGSDGKLSKEEFKQFICDETDERADANAPDVVFNNVILGFTKVLKEQGRPS